MSAIEEQVRTLRGLSGQDLYGDDFSPDEIKRWFADEAEGYFNLYGRAADPDGEQGGYAYSALAELHGYRWIADRSFNQVLGVGSADGAELLPVLHSTSELTILEPSDGFASSAISGKPVRYVKPEPSGKMPFADSTFDLVVCFSALHHIPNVSFVVGEMARVLKPGGKLLLREPTHSMGDWRQPRLGLTRRERGIPLAVFRRIVDGAGLQVVKQTRCNFSLIGRLQRFIKNPIWSLNWLVRLDAWLCSLPIWPQHYHATKTWQKLRPTGVAFVLMKPK